MMRDFKRYKIDERWTTGFRFVPFWIEVSGASGGAILPRRSNPASSRLRPPIAGGSLPHPRRRLGGELASDWATATENNNNNPSIVFFKFFYIYFLPESFGLEGRASKVEAAAKERSIYIRPRLPWDSGNANWPSPSTERRQIPY